MEHRTTIQIGKLGTFVFERGTYVYVGSAKRNIISRINRHKALEKPLRWHFDYLRPHGNITKIITYDNSIGECGLAEKLRKQEGGVYPVKGFGSSDCKCYSHLIYFP
jgi:Uri superfamily endonuclease